MNVFKYQPAMTEIDVDVNLGAKTDIVLADADQLRQVFLNVMINAADAIVSAERRLTGNITITSEIENKPQKDLSGNIDILRINTIDNGVGIEKENLAHLFDPFYTTKEPGKGTGLGLSVCFMIVEGIGGEIQVSSHPGEGTTISILLPIHHDA
jgi:signal transduction histidine kinase